MNDAVLLDAAWSVANFCSGPVCGGLRILAMLTLGGLMSDVAIPWRFRVCISGLLG